MGIGGIVVQEMPPFKRRGTLFCRTSFCNILTEFHEADILLGFKSKIFEDKINSRRCQKHQRKRCRS
jgi:hypothetical protein